jgi:PAS domain S-box-containing protein
MSRARWVQCALLLVFTTAPLSSRDLQSTSFSGWPSLGFAIAFLLVAGRKHLRPALGVLVVVATGALSFSYEISLAAALIGSVALVLPAWLTQHLLTQRHRGQVRLREVDSAHYHTVTAASAGLCGLLAILATSAAGNLGAGHIAVAFLMSVLAALTAQLAVLPLLLPGSHRPPAGNPAELWAQRILLAVLVLGVFWPTTSLSIAFLVFPMLGWAAVRATRREAHVQLFLVCVLAYVLTFHGRGPVAIGEQGVPDELAPALVYLFIGAACYMTVPLVLAVERLFSANAEATRAATTLERLLAAGTGAIFIATDAEGRITHFNAGAEHTLGYARDEVLDCSPAMFHTGEEVDRQANHLGVQPDHTAVIREMVRTGERRDWEFLHKDGTTRMASLTMSEVTQGDGEVVAYIGTGEDITERLRAQEALITALDREHASVLRLEEVDHVKQELVSNVSHELRTPITSIAGYAELLADRSLGELNRQQVEAMHRIRRNTDRLGLLVEDLLTLSRAESGKLELDRHEIDLRTVAAEAFDLLHAVLRVRDLDVRRELPDEPVMVLGDAHALERVVINLVGNAIKFTPDGGTIVLAVTAGPSEACISVCDTGHGIAKADQERLFTRFFRASAATEHAIQGTGLGLSIVHSLVTQHEGTVTIDSAPGSGTTVRVALPRCGARHHLAPR